MKSGRYSSVDCILEFHQVEILYMIEVAALPPPLPKDNFFECSVPAFRNVKLTMYTLDYQP